MRTSTKTLFVAGAILCGVILLSDTLVRSEPDRAKAVATARVAVCDVVMVFNNYQRAKDLTQTMSERPVHSTSSAAAELTKSDRDTPELLREDP